MGLRIARVMTRLNLGGPARQALASDVRLKARGHVLRLFAGRVEPGEGDLFEALEARGVDVVRVEGLQRGLSPRDLLVRRRLRRELAAFAPDVVHTHASKAGALGRSALATGRFDATARVHTFHGHVLEGYFPGPISARLVQAERRLARRTDRILAVSHATADDLVRLGVVEEDKIVVVPPGVELDELLAIERDEGNGRADNALRTLVGARPETFLVGLVGRLAEVKRPLEALEVLRALAERHPTLELCFVGDGALRRSLERAIAGLGPLAGRVHLVGARADMPTVLAGLDAVLLTSRTEGLPVALIEAGAAGLPVVASAVGGVGELVVHERTGWVGGTLEELVLGLERLLADRREARAMGARARLRVAARHGADALADRLEEVYRVVLAERRGAEVSP
jgi:glycosyltransferase involved in cell wall biosynthesis